MELSCSICHIIKPETDFYIHRFPRRKYVCKTCYKLRYKDYQIEYKAEFRERLTGTEKSLRKSKKLHAVQIKGSICEDCKGVFPACAFDFHHLNSKEKIEEVNFTKSWNNIQEELNKCVLLCANCHRIRHHKEK